MSLPPEALLPPTGGGPGGSVRRQVHLPEDLARARIAPESGNVPERPDDHHVGQVLGCPLMISTLRIKASRVRSSASKA
jgi:hypothetical protein